MSRAHAGLICRALTAAASAAAACSAPARPAPGGGASPWPVRDPSRIVVPSPGGTGIDSVARMPAQRLAARAAVVKRSGARDE